MKREYPIAAVVLLSALAVAGALASPAAVTTTTAQASNASITFNDQQATDSVVVESATLPDGGFVVVYNSSGAVIGNSSLLDTGTHENITVEVSPPFARSGVAIAEVHRDNDSDGAFNATTDVAYNTSTGNAVSSTAYITVESTDTAGQPASGTETATTTAATDETETEVDTTEPDGDAETTSPAEATDPDGTETTGPGFTLVAALVALVAAALLARRT